MSLLRRLLGEGGSRPLGERGERLAERHLKRAGYRIIRRNLRIAKDEADLVAFTPDGGTVVVVEVKTRSGDDIAPEEGVNQAKRRHLSRLAARLQRRRRFADRPFRFDVIAITWPDGEVPDLRHYIAAFESTI